MKVKVYCINAGQPGEYRAPPGDHLLPRKCVKYALPDPESLCRKARACSVLHPFPKRKAMTCERPWRLRPLQSAGRKTISPSSTRPRRSFAACRI